MNCKTARHNIALHAGNDLDALTVRELKQHLHHCVECAAHWKQMVQSLKVLQVPARKAAPIHDSVWPGISRKLAAQRAPRRSERFNGWAPALAVAASCMLMLFVTQQNHPGNEIESLPNAPFRSMLGPPAATPLSPVDGDWSMTPSGAEAKDLLDNDTINQMLDELNQTKETRDGQARLRSQRSGRLP